MKINFLIISLMIGFGSCYAFDERKGQSEDKDLNMSYRLWNSNTLPYGLKNSQVYNLVAHKEGVDPRQMKITFEGRIVINDDELWDYSRFKDGNFQVFFTKPAQNLSAAASGAAVAVPASEESEPAAAAADAAYHNKRLFASYEDLFQDRPSVVKAAGGAASSSVIVNFDIIEDWPLASVRSVKINIPLVLGVTNYLKLYRYVANYLHKNAYEISISLNGEKKEPKSSSLLKKNFLQENKFEVRFLPALSMNPLSSVFNRTAAEAVESSFASKHKLHIVATFPNSLVYGHARRFDVFIYYQNKNEVTNKNLYDVISQSSGVAVEDFKIVCWGKELPYNDDPISEEVLEDARKKEVLFLICNQLGQ